MDMYIEIRKGVGSDLVYLISYRPSVIALFLIPYTSIIVNWQ